MLPRMRNDDSAGVSALDDLGRIDILRLYYHFFISAYRCVTSHYVQ